MRNFPHEVAPKGWYQIGWSGEFLPGQVVPMRYFDTDLVCFRDEHSSLRVFDAHCPHFGAHLGFGGRVEGDCIVCPFHGWVWGPDGGNVAIPYSKPDKMKFRLRQWTVEEIDGLVMLWLGQRDEPPAWPAPRILPEGSVDDFWPIYPSTSHIWRGVGFPPHASTENACDAAHFLYVHRAVDVPEVTGISSTEFTFRTEFTMRFGGHAPTTWATPEGPVDGHLTTIAHGLGMASGILQSYDTAYTLSSTTPIDDERSDHRATVWVPKKRPDGSDLDESLRDRWAKQQFSQHQADFPIWENMIYVQRPLFTKDESPIFRKFRAWSDRYYSDFALEKVATA